MSSRSFLAGFFREAREVCSRDGLGAKRRAAGAKIQEAVQETRTAAWHLREGGVDQLRLWRWKKASERAPKGRAVRIPRERLSREHRILRKAWSRNAHRELQFAAASVTRKYRNFFAQGWVLTSGPTPELPPNWISSRFGNLRFLYDPSLAVQHKGAPEGDVELLLLGHAADSERELSNSREVGGYLYDVLCGDDSDFRALDDAVTWLGGRFVVVARRGESICVHVDASASRSCYWGEDEKAGVVLASHAVLIGQLVGDESAEKARWVLGHPEYKNPQGVYLPGTVTACDRARLVFANCRLLVEGGNCTHSRFFPPVAGAAKEDRSVESAAEEYLSEVRFQLGAALAQTPRSVLALTSGSDSRAIVQATIDLLQESDTTAMTYHFFERSAEHTKIDLLGANRLAETMALRHRILDVAPWDPAGRFAKLYNRTFPVWARFGSLARTIYEGLSARESLIIGVGGEVGTAFYLIRDAEKITPEVLASKFTQTPFAQDPRLVEEFARYMEYTQLDPAHSGGYDLLDLFYWEHRLSGWAAYWYSEMDFGPTVVLPLNSRRLYCAMLSVPFEDRVKKSIYRTIDAWATETIPGKN